ncbi:hypothetical protein FFRU_020230 [Fructobacillus fructosus]|uniref:GNAT family N-acetyltransferase n=1 Tax=Fructobacillus fructosus TaxID=1631 RepID=UPI000219575E|nr:GNAT family N-acetyltransferase [Fructobacillus fructosus]KRN53055.1 GNAT family acetyltransferase [Fructobacillus fructosus KCTC 3544]GAP00833.1 hypothetical protein FFRU_020230 [Fructobacillus fructosus]
MIIRSAAISDAVWLQKINRQALGYDQSLEFTKQQLQLTLNDANHYLIAVAVDERNGEVVGYVHAELYRELYAEDAMNVLALAVQNERRGTGIGRQLMRWLSEEAEKLQILTIRLNSGIERTAAHDFYRHIGFTEVKTQKKFLKKMK